MCCDKINTRHHEHPMRKGLKLILNTIDVKNRVEQVIRLKSRFNVSIIETISNLRYIFIFIVNMWNPSHIENQDRKPLCPPPLICLESQSTQSSESPVLNLATRHRHGSSTSTPIETPKIQSKGSLIRPIPSRLGSPFSPILSPGLLSSGSTGLNSFALPLLGKSSVTPSPKDLPSSYNNQKHMFETGELINV